MLKSRKGSSDLGTAPPTSKNWRSSRSFKTPVLPKYNDTPLSKVVDDLAKLAGINIHLDPQD